MVIALKKQKTWVERTLLLSPIVLLTIGAMGALHQKLTWGEWFEICDINHEVIISIFVTAAVISYIYRKTVI